MDNRAAPKIKFDLKFIEEVDKYIEDCKQKKVTPNLEGYAKFIGTDKDSVLGWANKRVKDADGNLTDQLARPSFNAAIKKLQELEKVKETPQTRARQEKHPNLQKGNPGNDGGRPQKFKTVSELQNKIEEYFLSCWQQKIDMFGNPIFFKDKNGKVTDDPVMIQTRPYTITGLAVALDTTRETLLDYQENPEFSDAIKRAKQRCQAYAEEALYIGKNPSGAIFNLKNNYGWHDKAEVDHTTNGKELPTPIYGGKSTEL